MVHPSNKSRQHKRKAIFLDKDGTLVPDIPYNVDPRLISLSKNCSGGLKLLASEGYDLVIITNQPGIAYGFFDESAISGVTSRITELLSWHAINLLGFEYCPHHPQGSVATYSMVCDCRKPMAGMLFRAAEKYGIDLARSWMIGDILNDVEAGHRAGCRSVLINNGNETEWLSGPLREPDLVAATIDEAAKLILQVQSIEKRERLVGV